MERHSRLPRAGATLHHEDSGQRSSDHLVLLALHRGDDVAHPAGPAPLEGRQEYLGPGQAEAPARQIAFRVEQLVLDVKHGCVLGEQVAPPAETHRVRPGRPVEGLGHRRPPVHDDRLLVGAGNCESADVERLIGVPFGQPVDPPEHEGLPPQLEVLEPAEARPHPDVTLGHRLERAATLPVGVLEHGLCRRPHGREASVGQIHVRLLRGELGVCHRGNHQQCVLAPGFRKPPHCSADRLAVRKATPVPSRK
jgi:hypothetical protein